MLISGRYLKLTQRERDDIVLFCFAVFSAVRATSGIHIQRRDDRVESAVELIVGLMQASDLWSARFFAVAEYAEDYRRFFNVHVPAWFSDESKRSKSREQYRGIDGEAAKHRVRRWLNCQAILAAAKANGFSLGDLGLYLPHDLVNAQAEVEQWRAVEAERSARRRAQKKQDRNEATAEVESIPSEVEVLRQKLIESEAEKQALQRENTRLRSQANHMDAYRQAKHAVMSDAVDSNMFKELVAANDKNGQLQQHLAIARKHGPRPIGASGFRPGPELSDAQQVVGALVHARRMGRKHV